MDSSEQEVLTSDAAPSARTGHVCRCARCKVNIRVLTNQPPLVCPFCQARLSRESYAAAPPTPEPQDAHLSESSRWKHKPPRGSIVMALAIVSIILISFAIFMKLHNVAYFWYGPWVSVYSLTVGAFILTRFIFSAFYCAPADVGYEPSLTVVIACRNEEGSIEKTIGRVYSAGYPRSKTEVVVVNDGSTDNTLRDMMTAQGRYPSLVVVDLEEHRGKRHAMAAGALLAHGEILVYIDSDSFVFPGALYKIVQGLADPTVGAVSGHTDVENVGKNVLTEMQDVRYYVSYRVMKGAEHIFGAVSCCPGCFSAYRKSYVLNVLDRWLHQRWLGTYATYGDDRSLTNMILRNYRVLYDDEAIATTIVPEGWYKYAKQQARWKRSWIRELFFAGRFMWRKHPIAAISWYAMTLLPLFAPMVMFVALFWGPLFMGRPPFFYAGGVLVVTLLWSLYYLERTGRPHWWTGFVFMITYIFFFSWQGYYAALTARTTSWGTR